MCNVLFFSPEPQNFDWFSDDEPEFPVLPSFQESTPGINLNPCPTGGPAGFFRPEGGALKVNDLPDVRPLRVGFS